MISRVALLVISFMKQTVERSFSLVNGLCRQKIAAFGSSYRGCVQLVPKAAIF